MIEGVYPEFQVDEYLKGELAPVFFGSALNNFGVNELLNCFLEIAPKPQPSTTNEREMLERVKRCWVSKAEGKAEREMLG